MGLKNIERFPVITPRDIPKFDTVEAEGVVLLYDLVHPMIGEVCVEYCQDRVFELFECAKKVISIRLNEDSLELLANMNANKNKKAKPTGLVGFYTRLPDFLKKPALGTARFFKQRHMFPRLFSNLKQENLLNRCKVFYQDPTNLQTLYNKWDKFMKEYKHVKTKVFSLK